MGAIGGDELARWEKTDGLGAAAGGGGGGAGKEERILVSVRLRPLNAKEIARGDPSDWECINDNTIIFRNSLPERSMYPAAYTFDRVFRCECTTKQVYEEGAKEVALSVVSGINSSIFAYGQTSSGKTYTMTGITEYTVADIYDYIQRHEERAFVLKFSAMEIYNEAVKDLLCTDNTPLRLLDDPERGTIVEKLTEEILRDWNHLKELLSMCEAQRQIGETSLNETSSRSHQILRLTIESSAREFLGKENSSTLTASVNFVDLAGSERASQALSAGTRLKEGCHINRSLLTLGTVIRKLSKGRNGHIPYRDSKLTRILQPSLGGNARTAIICTMSPAQSHIEQSRNTLLFASCAKAVVTSAQVNVVMSDKALVKHLQKELARLESELRYPGSASTTRHPEALLREKDAQIRKMEKEIKELMQQRDLAQSRLEDLLRGVGDDRASRQWEQFSQLSPSHVPFACEDVLSISESFGVADQSLDFGFTKFSSSYGSSNCNEHYFSSSYEKPKEQYASSPKHSINSPRFTGLIPHVGGKGIAQDTYDDFEDHCKEVRCIEMDESSTSRSEESNSLLIEGSESLIPLTDDANKNRCQEPEFKRDTDLRPVSTDQTVVTLEQQLLNMRKTSDNLVKPYPVESSPWSSMRDLSSSKSLALTRSRSCRATLITTASSTWFQDIEQNDNTPPSSYLKDFPGRREVFPRRLFTINYSADKEMLSGEGSQASEHSPSSEVHKAQNIKSASEEDIPSFGTFVAGLKEMAQNQYQEQCTDDQETERNINEDFGVERTVKDVGLDPMMNPSESPSRWPLEFERKQQEIIELWHACNVSLVHRTYFYLLFKGDPADSIYMEVELRSLKRTFSQENLDKPAVEDGHNVSLTTSMRKLRREREGLCSKMQKRLSVEERESLYTKWGIALDSKQRRLQLARRLWTETRDVEHVRESASIVAKLIGLPEPAQALKEMFELSFTPQRINRRSYSWKHGRSSIKEQRW